MISAPLAKLVHLASSGPPSRITGVAGCSAKTQPVAISNWSLASVPLASAALQSLAVPGAHGRTDLGGVLGADVLARFGAFRVDYERRSLVVPGPEGPAITGTQTVKGPTGQAVPPGLTSTPDTGAVPLGVVERLGEVQAVAPVSFGTPRVFPFVIDTGSSVSSASGFVARLLLHRIPRQVRVGTFGCVSTFSLVQATHWKLGSVPLVPQLLTTQWSKSLDISPPGLIGSDVLRSFGWVVIDYSGGELVLGKRT